MVRAVKPCHYVIAITRVAPTAISWGLVHNQGDHEGDHEGRPYLFQTGL